MSNFDNEMAMIEAGVKQMEAKIQEYEVTIRNLKAKLRLKNLDRILTLSQAATIAQVSRSTVWRWKQDSLKHLKSGKIMYSDLIEYMAMRNPDRVRRLGFDPENFLEAA